VVTRTTTYSYEQSSEAGRERMVRIPYARLLDATPTLHDPAAVTDAIITDSLTGTVISLDAVDSIAVLNVAYGAVFCHNVRNVTGYNAQQENAWRVIAIGDTVYYDPSATMPADTKLSLAPNSGVPAANTKFGTVVLMQDETAASFTKGAGNAGSTHVCAILQNK